MGLRKLTNVCANGCSKSRIRLFAIQGSASHRYHWDWGPTKPRSVLNEHAADILVDRPTVRVKTTVEETCAGRCQPTVPSRCWLLSKHICAPDPMDPMFGTATYPTDARNGTPDQTDPDRQFHYEHIVPMPALPLCTLGPGDDPP